MMSNTPSDTLKDLLEEYSYLGYYYCPRCKKIPEILLTKDTYVEIRCQCFEIKDTILENRYIPLDMTVLTKYSTYILYLDTFINVLEKNPPKNYCELSFKHRNRNQKPCEYYCTECKKLLCLSCFQQHQDEFFNHIVYKSNGMKMNFFCESNACSFNGKIEYYCDQCKQHFCRGCLKAHNTHTRITKINTIFTQEDIKKIEEKIKKLKTFEKPYDKYHMSYLLDLNYTEDQIKSMLNQNKTDIENILKFFGSLLNAYYSTERMNNYQIRNNFKLSDISEIYFYKKSLFEKNALNLSLRKKDPNYKSVIKATYEVTKLDEDTKILGDYYNCLGEDNCILKLNGKEIPFSKKIKVEIKGEYNIEFIIKEGFQLTNMFSMFHHCSALISIDLSEFDVSFITTMRSAFYECTSITSINLNFKKNSDTSNVLNTRGMFLNCGKLKDLDLSQLNTSNVVDMEFMFWGCSSLTSLNFNNFDTKNVKDMNQMFHDCENISYLDLSKFDTSKVTDMSFMFNKCALLTSIKLNNFNTTNVRDMSCMFSNCSDLTSLDLTNFNTVNVTDMADMFRDCTLLKYLDISSFNTPNLAIMESLFYQCSSLVSLNLLSFNTSNVIKMNHCFYNCSSLTSLNLGSFNTINATTMHCMFCGCKKLKYLNLSSFETINVTSMYYMFCECVSLVSLDISGFDTQNVINMYQMFHNCRELKELDLSNFRTDNATDLRGLLSGCSSLFHIDLSNFNTSKTTMIEGMLSDCSALEYLDLWNLNLGSVSDAKKIFVPKKENQAQDNN
ncbi:MAG: BspA family leucine-rich repeat surface protein [archaeon]|nr:BspA family leucine-rich repeat surface protein [archaeon]